MSILMIVALVTLLTVVALAREIRQDGRGVRPAPRSRADDEEPRWVQLSRLAR